MAKIIWNHKASMMLACHLEYAELEFGKATMLRWKKEIQAFEDRVRLYPEIYSPEHLLKGKPVLYRSRHLMKRRFKLIYYYEESEDAVYIVDIWDSTMRPEALVMRIK